MSTQTEPSSDANTSFCDEGRRKVFLRPIERKIKAKKTRKDFKEPLLINCLICNFAFKVKYVFARNQYSQKNNWGYWSQKEENRQKYFCNTCYQKIHLNASLWIENKKQCGIFYNYIKRGNFGKKKF